MSSQLWSSSIAEGHEDGAALYHVVVSRRLVKPELLVRMHKSLVVQCGVRVGLDLDHEHPHRLVEVDLERLARTAHHHCLEHRSACCCFPPVDRPVSRNSQTDNLSSLMVVFLGNVSPEPDVVAQIPRP